MRYATIIIIRGLGCEVPTTNVEFQWSQLAARLAVNGDLAAVLAAAIISNESTCALMDHNLTGTELTAAVGNSVGQPNALLSISHSKLWTAIPGPGGVFGTYGHGTIGEGINHHYGLRLPKMSAYFPPQLGSCLSTLPLVQSIPNQWGLTASRPSADFGSELTDEGPAAMLGFASYRGSKDSYDRRITASDPYKLISYGQLAVNTITQLGTPFFVGQPPVLQEDFATCVPAAQALVRERRPYLNPPPYNNFVIRSRHKLTPSVYALHKILPDKCGQKAASDFEHLLTIPACEEFMKADGVAKPVLMISADGSPDENPRYKKVIQHGIEHFRKHDLDAIFVFTNAPGRSTFTKVERRMAPLSKALFGVLPYDHFGSHLDARTVLSEIWSEMVIDGHPVEASYVYPNEELPDVTEMPQRWYVDHVGESKYMSQVVKCNNSSCCSLRRSNIHEILNRRFMPGPYALCQDPFGISDELSKNSKFTSFMVQQSFSQRTGAFLYKEVPCDIHCPPVRDESYGRTNTESGLY
ncbi:hypothetical protein FOCC_FOCC012228 [Frankliniella occidentalis]|nr:hypothetical protein FOCC_FOCC012228 [Frankliniella occidentalis]